MEVSEDEGGFLDGEEEEEEKEETSDGYETEDYDDCHCEECVVSLNIMNGQMSSFLC